MPKKKKKKPTPSRIEMSENSERHDQPNVVLDWDQLYIEWVNSRMSVDAFIKSKKLNNWSLVVKKRTSEWIRAAEQAAENMKEFDAEPSEVEKIAKMTDDLNPEFKQKKIPEPRFYLDAPSLSTETAVKDIWQIVSQWRQKQSENDYKLADAIRAHCKLILRNNLIVTRTMTGGQDVTTKIHPQQLLQLATIAEKIQRIQRLALGLSTENIGVDNMKETMEDNVPVFEVQMTSQGKFVKIR